MRKVRRWMPQTETGDLEIAPDEWMSFLDSFSRQQRRGFDRLID